MVGQRNGFPHEPGPETRSRADNWCIRLEMALRIFLVSTGCLGFCGFWDSTHSSGFASPKQLFRKLFKYLPGPGDTILTNI